MMYALLYEHTGRLFRKHTWVNGDSVQRDAIA